MRSLRSGDAALYKLARHRVQTYPAETYSLTTLEELRIITGGTVNFT